MLIWTNIVVPWWFFSAFGVKFVFEKKNNDEVECIEKFQKRFSIGYHLNLILKFNCALNLLIEFVENICAFYLVYFLNSK